MAKKKSVVKVLMQSIRDNKAASLFTIFCSMIEVVFEIIIPICMSLLLDKGIGQGNMASVWKYGLMLLGLAILAMTTGIFSARFGAKASVGFAANLREDMYKNVQTFSFSNIDKFSTSSIVTRLTTDVTNIQNAYQMIIRIAVRSPAMLIFAVIAAFKVDSEISMMFLVAIPVLFIPLMIISNVVHPTFDKVFRTYDKLNNIVQENVRGIRVVKSFNQEQHEEDKFQEVSASIKTNFTKAEKIISLNGPIMQFCMYTCMILISWFGAQAIIASGNNAANGLTTGSLTALFTYASQILMSLMMLSMIFTMVVISQASAKRIVEVLEEKSDITEPQDAVLEVKDGSIDFNHVGFVYASKADKQVLSDVDVHIKAGETIGIIGGTGSSKSSLVQLIPRLYDVTQGSVQVGGVDVRRYNLDALRHSVAMVLQKNDLFSGTLKENLKWGNEKATDEQMIQACKLACAHEFISAMPQGYDTYIEQGGVNVSGGQKQRICIARALLAQPKILILDDSTSAVDTHTDASIQKALSSYMPQTTKLVIAQRISSVQNADRIIVLDDGKINDIGTHEELLSRCDIYREVYESQLKGDNK